MMKRLCIILQGSLFLTVVLLFSQTGPANAAKKTEARFGSSPWVVKCPKNNPLSKKSCKMVQKILVKKTRKLLLGVAINKTGPNKDKLVMLLQLPTGLFLPAGVAVQIDKNKADTAIIQTCDIRGCFTGMPVSPTMLARMKKGKQITVAFKNLKKQTIAVGLSLKGFTAAFKRI